MTTPHIEAIFIVTQAGGAIEGSRDRSHRTLIEGEALDRMKLIHGVRVQNGEQTTTDGADATD